MNCKTFCLLYVCFLPRFRGFLSVYHCLCLNLFFFVPFAFLFRRPAGVRGWFPASYVELLLPPKPGQNQLEQEIEVEVEVAGSGGDDGAQDGDEEEALEEVAEAASSLASTVVKPMAGYVAPKAAFASSGLCVSHIEHCAVHALSILCHVSFQCLIFCGFCIAILLLFGCSGDFKAPANLGGGTC